RNANFQEFATPGMHIGLTIGDDEKSPVSQTGANMNGEPVGRPLGLSLLAQPSLGFRGGSGGGQCFRKGCDLTCQRAEQFHVRHLDARRRCSSGAQCSHPLRGAANRPCDAQTEYQQRDEDYEKYVGQGAEECFSPDTKTLILDVAGIMHDRQNAPDILLAMQGQSIDVHRGSSQPLEDVSSMIPVQRLGHYGRSGGHEWSEIFGYCDEAALTVVYGQTQQVFTVSEALHRPLQGLN